MNKNATQKAEMEVLGQAIQALTEQTGVQIHIKQVDVLFEEEKYLDALLAIGPAQVEVPVEIKLHAPHTNLGAIINQVQRLPGKPMLVADYINPKMAQRLKIEGVQYIDTAGNAYINLEPVYIFITGQKQRKTDLVVPNAANRAFEPKGLVVTYAFLTDPNLLNLPYRDIAVVTGVAVGTVGWVINALKDGNYIHEAARTRQRRITNYQRLLDRWVEAWPEKLKPKHQLGIFTTNKANWWKKINIEKYGGYWGGETAGAQYTNYLKPKITTIYLHKKELPKLIRDARLRNLDVPITAAENLTYMLTPFWTAENNELNNKREDYDEDLPIPAAPGLVNPVLAYADLVATGEPRNLETARIIYEKRIAKPDREN